MAGGYPCPNSTRTPYPYRYPYPYPDRYPDRYPYPNPTPAHGRRRQLSEQGAAGVEAPDDMQLPDVEAIGAVLWSSPTDVRGVDLGTLPPGNPPTPNTHTLPTPSSLTLTRSPNLSPNRDPNQVTPPSARPLSPSRSRPTAWSSRSGLRLGVALALALGLGLGLGSEG